MKEIDTNKLFKYLAKTNQMDLKFIHDYIKSNWEIPKRLTQIYMSKYIKDNDFILQKDEMEIHAQNIYLCLIINWDYKLPLTYKEFYK